MEPLLPIWLTVLTNTRQRSSSLLRMKNSTPRILALLLATGSLLQTSLAQEVGTADLPVTRVVLYKNGVAYFEHSGTVTGDQVFSLPARTEDMDDLLQSLVLLDRDGGSINAVRYAAEDPLSRTLSSYSLDLSGNPDLAGLLLQARGEAVTLVSSQSVSGTIVSVERVSVPEEADRHFVLLSTDDGLRRVDLGEVSEVRFEDEQLRQELADALGAVARQRSEDETSIQLHFSGEGERSVQIGYVREMPVWKTSYRLVLGDEGTAELQGWAILDNPTGMDLQDVQVSFVAGQPVSFITSLYEAVYVQRQRLAPQVARQDGPPAVFNSVAMEMEQVAPAPMQARAAFEDAAMGSIMNAGVEAQASGVQTGVTFQYVVDQPVTVGRFESAMIPIVQEEIPAQNLSVFDPQRGSGHPLRGVQLENDTGLHLAAGTVTVFDGGAFTGTALVNDVLPGDTALLAFATDLSVEVQHSTTRDAEQVQSIRLQQGVLHSEIRERYRSSYEVIADVTDSRLIAIEHPRRSGFDLITPSEPAPVTTPDSYRFGVALAAEAEAGDLAGEPGLPLQLECPESGSCVLEVIEERVATRSVVLSNMTTDSIVILLQNELLDADTEALLQQLVELGQQITELQREHDALAARRSAIFQEQERIRANMAALAQNSSLYQRYTTQLNDQEDELEEIAAELSRLEQELQELEVQRDALLSQA